MIAVAVTVAGGDSGTTADTTDVVEETGRIAGIVVVAGAGVGAVVCIVADAVAVGIGRTRSSANADGVVLVAVAVTIAGGDSGTTADTADVVVETGRIAGIVVVAGAGVCLLYTSPSPRD